jgi:uncharacterized protein YndB with AHSA1/START domain
MASGTFRHTTRVPVPADRVWTALQNAGTWAGIGPIDGVSGARHRADGTLDSFEWKTRAGGRDWRGSSRTSEAARPHRVVMAFKTRGFQGEIAVDLAPRESITELTATLHVEATGMLARLLWSALDQAIAGGFPDQVEELAAGIG